MSSATKSKLLSKITSKKASVGIIGLGYVGLPLACAFASKGFKVKGMDISVSKVASINKGESYIGDISSKELKRHVNSGKLQTFDSYDPVAKVDVVIICVPTPLNRVKDPDISYIVSTTKAIQKRLHRGQLIILESTTYPGTTEEVILPALQKSGLKIGRDFFLCFSPERIDPGNPDFSAGNIPKVVGGITEDCGKLGAAIYSKVTTKVVRVSTSRTAEMTKLLENTFRIVNIGLVNELARAAGSLNVNIWEAIDAAKTKPFGYMAFYPGPGIGGHCIGIDPLYLSWKARIHGTDLHFIELARRINSEMPQYVVSQAVYALNQYRHKAVSRSKVLLLGVAYKPDVADTRESPALDIMQDFYRLGAEVNYHDPYVPTLKNGGLRLKSKPLSAAMLKKQDLVVITTNHSKFKYRNIVKSCPLIFDTRNALKDLKDKHIVRL